MTAIVEFKAIFADHENLGHISEIRAENERNINQDNQDDLAMIAEFRVDVFLT